METKCSFVRQISVIADGTRGEQRPVWWIGAAPVCRQPHCGCNGRGSPRSNRSVPLQGAWRSIFPPFDRPQAAMPSSTVCASRSTSSMLPLPIRPRRRSCCRYTSGSCPQPRLRPTTMPPTSAGSKSIVLLSQSYSPEKPVILHELMHAYHDQKVPERIPATPTSRKLYHQAQTSGQFPAGVYMLSNPVEYFAMMASVYLHGTAARDPNTRQEIKDKQPDCYQWLLKEFGPRVIDGGSRNRVVHAKDAQRVIRSAPTVRARELVTQREYARLSLFPTSTSGGGRATGRNRMSHGFREGGLAWQEGRRLSRCP